MPPLTEPIVGDPASPLRISIERTLMGQAVASEKKPRPSLAGLADQGGTSNEPE